MCPPLSRRKLLAGGSIAGLSTLAGCQGVVSPLTQRTPDESEANGGGESLGLAYSESRPSFPSEEETHSGWVHIVSHGESADLTFDVRLCSELGDVEPELTNAISNDYVLRFTVSGKFSSGTSSNEPTGDSECSSVTHLVGGANVPNDWESLTVAVNNDEIQTIERSGSTPELRPLPDPVRPR